MPINNNRVRRRRSPLGEKINCIAWDRLTWRDTWREMSGRWLKTQIWRTGRDLKVIFKGVKIRVTKLGENGDKVALDGRGWARMFFKGNNCSRLEDVLQWWRWGWWWWRWCLHLLGTYLHWETVLNFHTYSFVLPWWAPKLGCFILIWQVRKLRLSHIRWLAHSHETLNCRAGLWIQFPLLPNSMLSTTAFFCCSSALNLVRFYF